MIENLWENAYNTLKPNDQKGLLRFREEKVFDKEKLLATVKTHRDDCLNKRWKIKKFTTFNGPNGEQIIVRDLVEKVVNWVERFMQVGDIAIQVDPVHAALPWAAVRVFLVMATSDVKRFSAMLEVTELISRNVARYAVFEALYLCGTACQATNVLQEAVVDLYASILKMMSTVHVYYSQNTGVHIAQSIFVAGNDYLLQATNDLIGKQRVIDECASMVDAERSKRSLDGISTLQDGMQSIEKDLRSILSDLEEPINRMSVQIQELHDDLIESQRASIVRWMSPIPYKKHHQTIKKSRLHESGLWLRQTKEFRLWRTSSYSSMLWLRGDPGSGKSVMVSTVIDWVTDTKTNSSPVAYFYCSRDTAEPERSKSEEVLRCIARQLSTSIDGHRIREPLLCTYRKAKSEGLEERLTLEEAVDFIIELAEENPATIVIDALDECDHKTRRDLLEGLRNIVEKSDNVMKIFVSSRDEPDINCILSAHPNLAIDASQNTADIERYAKEEIDNSIRDKRLLLGNIPQDLKLEILSTLIGKAGGCKFRWVSLQIDSLCDSRIMRIPADVKKLLKNLPRKLKDSYEVIYKQMEYGGLASTPLAVKALKWLFSQQQNLSATEFIKALTIGSNEDEISSVDEVLRICCNFIKYDTELDVFRFFHLSVREYLEERPDYAEPLAHAVIGESCLHVCLASQRPYRISKPVEGDSKTLRDYANVYWPYHCELSRNNREKGTLKILLRSFLLGGSRATAEFVDWNDDFYESLLEMDLSEEGGSGDTLFGKLIDCFYWGPHPNPIFVCCAFGFTEIITELLDTGKLDLNVRNQSYSLEPLYVALRHNQDGVVKILATREDNVENGTYMGSRKLLATVYAGKDEAVLRLLKQHKSIPITDEIFETAAAGCGKGVLLALEEFAGKRFDNETMIEMAAQNSRDGIEMMRTLLHRQSEDLRITETAYSNVAANEEFGVELMRLFLRRNANRTISEETLKAAASNRRRGVKLMALLTKSNPNLKITQDVFTAAMGNPMVLQLLLDQGFGVPITEEFAEIAAGDERTGYEVVKLLLEQDIPIPATDDVLIKAIQNRKHDLALTRLLLGPGTVKRIGPTVLETAAESSRSNVKMVTLLFEHDQHLLATKEAMHLAAQNPRNSPELIRKLLSRSEGVIVTEEMIESVAKSPNSDPTILEIMLEHNDGLLVSSDMLFAASQNPHIEGFKILLKRVNAATIGEDLLEEAASNRTSGLEMMDLLLHLDKCSRVTERIIEVAAGNDGQGEKVLALLLDRDEDVGITAEAIRAAAGNMNQGVEVMKLLLDRYDGIALSPEVIEAAAENWSCGIEVLSLLRNHDGYIIVTEESYEAVVGCGNKQMLQELLSNRDPMKVTDTTLESAVSCRTCPADMLKILLGSDENIHITEDILITVASGRDSRGMVDMMSILFKRDDIKITHEVMKTVAGNASAGVDTLELLLRQGEDKIITEEVLLAAARSGNTRNLKFLLKQDKELAKGVQLFKAAVGNERLDSTTMELLLGNNASFVTSEAILTAAKNLRGGQFKLLLEKWPDLPITECILKAAAENLYDGDAVLKVLMKVRPDLPVTNEVVEVAAANWPSGIRILKLLVKRTDDHLPINAKAIKTAARHNRVAVFKLLLRREPKLVSDDELFRAVAANKMHGTEMFHLLIRLNYKAPSSHDLIKSATCGDLHFAKLLLRRDPGLVIKEEIFEIFAASGCSEQILRLLSSRAEAQVEWRQWSMVSELFWAVRNGRTAKACKLIRESVRNDLADDSGRTPLSWAAGRGRRTIVEKLLEHGAGANSEDELGETRRVKAMENGHVAVAQLLEKHMKGHG